jgi:predicted aldo/keto reductase-like oxidoreductase
MSGHEGERKDHKECSAVSRRNFLKYSALGLGAAGAAAAGRAGLLEAKEKEAAAPLKIKSYRMLGRTGFKVSDIASGRPTNLSVLNYLLDTGVNYIDTAESYANGKSEIWIGQALKNRSRKSYFVTTKLELAKSDTRETILRRARKCLERLDTPYLDCMMMHNPTGVKQIKNNAFHEAMKQLKTEGKVRFLGISNHGSSHWDSRTEPMDKILISAAQDGRFDVILLVYNFLQTGMGERILAVCKEKNIGTTLMKTNPVGKYQDIKSVAEAYEKSGKAVPRDIANYLEQLKKTAAESDAFVKKYGLQRSSEIRAAALRFVLSNPNVSSALCRCDNFEDVEQFVPVSGTTLSAVDKRKLAAFKRGPGRLYCRHACGLCEPGCAKRVPVNTIMRYNHYFEAQGLEKYAMQKYAALPVKADLCRHCSGPCRSACPFEVPVQGLLALAHQRLSMTVS